MNRPLLGTFCLVSLLLQPQYATATEATLLTASRIGDTKMTCGQLSQEAVLMRDIVVTTEDIKEDTELKNYGITAAGAVGSFLISSITGGVGIAAAGYLLKETTSEKSEQADGVQDIAEQRRMLMIGIYNAKGCNGPIEHAFAYDVEKNIPFKSQNNKAFDVANIEPAAGDEKEPKQRFNN